MGAKLIKLISSPIQADNQDEDETAIIDPTTKRAISRRYLDLVKIKKKKT